MSANLNLTTHSFGILDDDDVTVTLLSNEIIVIGVPISFNSYEQSIMDLKVHEDRRFEYFPRIKKIFLIFV